VENNTGIGLHKACYKNSENLKNGKQAENFVLENQDEFQNGRSCVGLLFCVKLLIEKGRDFNSVKHLKFFDCMKNCDKVNRDKLFEILQREYILKLIIENIKKFTL
jgi:hypothetical protein